MQGYLDFIEESNFISTKTFEFRYIEGMELLLLIFLGTLVLNLIVSHIKKDDWPTWVTLTLIIGPLSLPF